MQPQIDHWLKQFDPYRKTKHGENPWTADALANVIAYRYFYDMTVGVLEGELSSCFRSRAVNREVGGHKSSAHLFGLACDIIPGYRWTLSSAAHFLFENCDSGRFGPIRKIIIEGACVHVSWQSLLAPNPTVELRQQDGKKFPLLKRKGLPNV